MKFMVLCTLFIFIGGFFGMMHMKSDVQELVRERKNLVVSQRKLQEEIRVLQAEVAHLSRPERLRVWAKKEGFKPVELWQLSTFKKGGADGTSL